MKKHSKIAIATLCAICFGTISFGLVSCTGYNPSLFPSYDVLNPGPEVRMNPIGFDADGHAIVNQAFILYVYELRQEVKRLRTELKKK